MGARGRACVVACVYKCCGEVGSTAVPASTAGTRPIVSVLPEAPTETTAQKLISPRVPDRSRCLPAGPPSLGAHCSPAKDAAAGVDVEWSHPIPSPIRSAPLLLPLGKRSVAEARRKGGRRQRQRGKGAERTGSGFSSSSSSSSSCVEWRARFGLGATLPSPARCGPFTGSAALRFALLCVALHQTFQRFG
jgi:hypothetical protein